MESTFQSLVPKALPTLERQMVSDSLVAFRSLLRSPTSSCMPGGGHRTTTVGCLSAGNVHLVKDSERSGGHAAGCCPRASMLSFVSLVLAHWPQICQRLSFLGTRG